jgi:hypothetical protein
MEIEERLARLERQYVRVRGIANHSPELTMVGRP